MSITILIVIVTSLTSVYAFSNPQFFNQLTFHPTTIWHYNQWHRLFSMVFLHVNVPHLIFNMFALYSFGPVVERGFGSNDLYGVWGSVVFVIFYFTAAAAANIFNLFRHREDFQFSSAGASGAVSAVMFSFILFYPSASGFSLFFIPLGPTPAWVIGLVFLLVSTFLANRKMDKIDHAAHFWGAVYGFIFPTVGHFWLLQQFIKSILP